MKKAKKAGKSRKGKKAEVAQKKEMPDALPGHPSRFDQLLDDAIFGVKKK